MGGAGGGGKDTSNTGVRIRHLPSGASGVGVDHRSQQKNKQDAFVRMGQSKEFHKWVIAKASMLMSGKSVDQMVDESMCLENLRIEAKDGNGPWEVISE